MFKSQIKKAITTAYLKGTPHKCHSFPNTPEGIELLKAYLLSQFKYPFGMIMELDVVHTPAHQCNSKSGVNWDVSYVIRNGNFASISERIFRLYGTDTHINVPRKFPRLTREYVLKDIRDDGLTLHSLKASNWSLDHISQDQVDTSAIEEKHKEPLAGILRKPTYAGELPKSPSGLRDLHSTDANDKIIEQEVARIKERYPEMSEEQIRKDLTNMTKE